jgi:hypothetical protein
VIGVAGADRATSSCGSRPVLQFEHSGPTAIGRGGRIRLRLRAMLRFHGVFRGARSGEHGEKEAER